MITAKKSEKTRRNSNKLQVKKVEEMSDTVSESGELGDEDSDSGNSSGNEKSIESDGENPDSKLFGNPGWADAMQKILRTNKPKKKKTLILSRAKKISEVKPKAEKVPFQIESQDGEIKEEIIEKKCEKDVQDEEAVKKKRRDKMRHSIRIKPSPLDRPREKLLQRVATKGVVQFFNAVRQQQEEIDKKLIKAGPVEQKREKVLKNIDKRAFLDVLMGGTKSVPVDEVVMKTKEEENDSEKPNKVWNVLRDDFVMGANLKDWDKKAPEEEEEEDSSEPEEMESD